MKPLKEKISITEAIVTIGMILEDVDYETPLSTKESAAWNKILEVVRNSEEYNEERESK